MKKKLTLNIDELRIEQFQVEPDGVLSRGTVQGFDVTDANSEPCRLCPPMPITYSCEDTPCC